MNTVQLFFSFSNLNLPTCWTLQVALQSLSCASEMLFSQDQYYQGNCVLCGAFTQHKQSLYFTPFDEIISWICLVYMYHRPLEVKHLLCLELISVCVCVCVCEWERERDSPQQSWGCSACGHCGYAGQCLALWQHRPRQSLHHWSWRVSRLPSVNTHIQYTQ